jgi:hypothetical protein
MLTNGFRRDSINLAALQQSKNFENLGDQSRYIIAALLDTKTSISKDLQDQTLAITRMLGRSELISIDREKMRTKSVALEATHTVNKTHKYTVTHEIKETGDDTETDEDDESAPLPVIEQPISRRREWIHWDRPGQHEEKLMLEERALKRAQKSFNIVWRQTGTEIINSLNYASITDRYEQVAEAHKKTFDWIFDHFNEGVRPWTNFSQWLRTGQGVYWINGKVASGKSTLMRHIVNHKETEPLLRQWADPLPLCQPSFFFWNSGTFEQRSQTGLLRSLLHDILRQHRHLIPVVLPRQWAKQYNRHLDRTSNDQEYWPLSKLKDAFNLLMEQKLVPLRMCLLIDGLDEYEGNWEEIAEFKSITLSGNIKVCVSSRPLQVFEDAFGQCSGLRLQDLSFDDIRLYVRENLAASPRFEILRIQEPLRAPELVEEIVTKADGVFLWVKLVVQSLREGLGNRDTIRDLQRRLKALPADLEALYRVLCTRIDPFYEEQASQIFQIVRTARMADSVPKQSETFEEATPIAIFELGLAFDEDLQRCSDGELKQFDLRECCLRSEDMEVRLKTRCAGLLEVQGYQRLYRGRANSIVHKWNGKVQYLHRTARDFLESPKEWQAITFRTSTTGFDADLALLRAYVLLLGFPGLGEREIPRIVKLAMEHAQHYQDNHLKQESNLSFPWLDALDRTMSSRTTAWPPQFRPIDSADGELNELTVLYWEDNFISLSIQYGLFDYVCHKVRHDPGLFSRKSGRPLLSYAIKPIAVTSPQFFPGAALVLDGPKTPSIKIAKFLLEQGANPNQVFKTRTPWVDYLRFLKLDVTDVMSECDGKSECPYLLPHFVEMVILMFSYGADKAAFKTELRRHHRCLSTFLQSSQLNAKQLKDCLGEGWIVPQPFDGLAPLSAPRARRARRKYDPSLKSTSSKSSTLVNSRLRMIMQRNEAEGNELVSELKQVQSSSLQESVAPSLPRDSRELRRENPPTPESPSLIRLILDSDAGPGVWESSAGIVKGNKMEKWSKRFSSFLRLRRGREKG